MIWHNISSLWLLLLIPLVAGLLWWYRHRQEKRLDRVFDRRLLSRLRVGFWARGIRLKVILILTAFSFFIVGLAGPRIGTEVRDVERRGLDLLVVLDLSRSMNAEDIRPNRLEKAKFEIQRLIEHSRGDRIGLLVFTGEAFVQSPVTQDYSALRMFLDIAETRQLPGSTTNFRAAFEKAKETYDRLEPRPEAARVVLMISDGENHGPSYNSALDELTSDGVHVFTLGIGTGGG
ncbi:MAG: VWA domain-containing protein, partial [Balneolaceae bacterium]